MYDSGVMRRLHGTSQRDQKRDCLGGGQRRAGELAGESSSIHKFRGEIGLTCHIPEVKDLQDIIMMERRFGLGTAQKTLNLLTAGVCSRQEHFQGHMAAEPDVPRLVNDAHPAAAQYVLQFVAGNLHRFGGWRTSRSTVPGETIRREQTVDAGFDRAEATQAVLNLWQQLRKTLADFLWRAIRIENLCKEVLDARVFGHS